MFYNSEAKFDTKLRSSAADRENKNTTFTDFFLNKAPETSIKIRSLVIIDFAMSQAFNTKTSTQVTCQRFGYSESGGTKRELELERVPDPAQRARA